MRSGREIVLEQFLKERGFTPEHSVREYGLEFDLYLRDRHIAFEFNGIAYHFSRCNHRVKGRAPKPITYHRDKSLLALHNGILLYHFWDFERIDDVKLQMLKVLNGQTISYVNADKNPSLLANSKCSLEPRYVFQNNYHAYQAQVPYENKPICWASKDVTIYEYYNSGYLW